MSNAIACERCGQGYRPTDLPPGLCPVCLLANALPAGESAVDAAHGAGDPRADRFVPPRIRELAPHFPQLEIQELAGRGGMSAVYKARQTHLDRTVAIKLLPLELAAKDGGLERFRREAQTLAGLSHPNIVDVHDAGQAGPWCFIVMEYVDGPNLRQLMGDSPLPSSDVLRIAAGICDGLEYAHGRGVVHRDIKPENVLLDGGGNVKLVDFGLAKLLGPQPIDAATRTGQVLGTPHYLAPEQVETPSRVDRRADVYSLGVLLYEMLTGELPLGHFEPPSRRGGSDPAFDAVVLQAMSKDPQRRPQSAREVHACLAAAAGSQGYSRARAGRPAWRRLLNESFLSACSIVAGLYGCLLLSKAMSVRILSRLESAGTEGPPFDPPSAAIALFAFLISFLAARINVSSRARWGDLSLAQIFCAPILVVAYAVVGGVLLLGPGLAMLLFGSMPLLTEWDHWSVLGSGFTELDRISFLTPYWLRVYGAGALACAAWSGLLAFVVRARPGVVRRVFHPAHDETGAAFTRMAALVGAAFLAPAGCALLYASWLGAR